MPRRGRRVLGAPCWVDLMTSNPDRSRVFYTELMGWTAEDPNPEFGGYFNFRKDDVRVAGCMGRQPGMEAPDAWSVYLTVEDARRTLDVASARGGAVIVSAMDVADLGTMAVMTDPAGAAIGVWQPGVHPGFGIAYEAGAPAWFELHTHEYARELDFYRDVFGWNTRTESDTPEFRYTIVQDGDEQLAGVMDDSVFSHGGKSPSYWLTYLGVPDTDAAVTRVRELGGTITRDAEDTPYGRLASVTDPTGAAFNVAGPNLASTDGAPSPEAQAQVAR